MNLFALSRNQARVIGPANLCRSRSRQVLLIPLLALALVSISSSFARAQVVEDGSQCSHELQAAPASLHLSYPAHTDLGQPVKVVFSLREGHLIADFEVQNSHLNTKPNLGSGEYPYQHDVVELFVSVADPKTGHFPYFEFELSPLDQTFNVQVNDLKKPFINNVDKGTIHHVQVIPGGWRGELDIPLANLGWDGDISKVAGNAYSIFGVAPNRSYWSLSIPNQPRPNFHQPQFFKSFFNCTHQ